MSRLRANQITNENANGAPNFPHGLTVTGIVTASTTNSTLSQIVVGSAVTANSQGIDVTGIVTATTVKVGSAISFTDGAVSATRFHGDGSTLTGISVGIATEASTATDGTTVVLDLSKDDHKVLASGVVTIDVTGGTEGDSHTIRIQNTGIATVGFATHFLFPSGAAPGLPVASGSKSMITFTVHKVGAAGTELFTGASVSFS